MEAFFSQSFQFNFENSQESAANKPGYLVILFLILALRVARGYFLNGQWTASNVGDYPAAGTLFHYRHVTNGNSLKSHGEKITAPGPLTEDVDVIVRKLIPAVPAFYQRDFILLS